MKSSYSAAAYALLTDNRDNGACIPAVGSCLSVGFGPDRQFSGLLKVKWHKTDLENRHGSIYFVL